jgi:hypothetical protein
VSSGIVVIGLDALVADLAGSTKKLKKGVRTATAVTARKVQQDARRYVRGFRHLPQYPQSITYTVRSSADVVEAEIGPDKDRAQGPLGNLIEYGSINNPPTPHLGPALEGNADDLPVGMAIALRQALP